VVRASADSRARPGLFIPRSPGDYAAHPTTTTCTIATTPHPVHHHRDVTLRSLLSWSAGDVHAVYTRPRLKLSITRHARAFRVQHDPARAMSMVLPRPPLEPLGMNGGSTSKRRSARLSVEGAEENEPPAKKSRVNGAQASNVSTKELDGDGNGLPKRRARKAYDEEVDGFAFKKGVRKVKEPKQPAVRNSVTEEQLPAAAAVPAPGKVASPVKPQGPTPAQSEAAAAPKPAPKKARRRFPTTPEREAAEKPIRRSKRLSSEHEPANSAPSPIRPAHAKSHANTERSPSPEKARPITIEKKRKRGVDGAEEEEKIMRITLPFQDTPVIRRNKEMRKGGDESGHRRSSSRMRGRRVSSMMDEGRGNGTYHATSSRSIVAHVQCTPYRPICSAVSFADGLCPAQHYLTPKSRPRSSTSTSPPTSLSRDGCGACSDGAVLELCHRNPKHRRIAVKRRVWSSKRCKPVSLGLSSGFDEMEMLTAT